MNNEEYIKTMNNVTRMINYKMHAEQLNIPIPNGFQVVDDGNPQTILLATGGGFTEHLTSEGFINDGDFDNRIDFVIENTKNYMRNNNYENVDNSFIKYKDYNNGIFNFKLYVQDAVMTIQNEKKVSRSFIAFFVEPKMHDFYHLDLIVGPFVMPTDELKIGMIDLENDQVTKTLDDLMKNILDNLKYNTNYENDDDDTYIEEDDSEAEPKEINQIGNNDLKIDISNSVIDLLLNKKVMTEESLPSVKVEFGYLYSKVDGVLEGLLKLICDKGIFYFALQNNYINHITISEEEYKDVIEHMVELHKCLSDTSSLESDSQKERREKNNQYLINNNITISNNLTCNKNESNINTKNIDDVCKRAIACLITIQIAFDINNNNYQESLEYFKPMYDKYNVLNSLNSKERRILEGTYTEQDVIDMDWAYETYWTLCWCLGLVDDIKDGGLLCDCEKAIAFVMNCDSYDEFKNKCSLRNTKEILDMYDLYYRYNWAINNKMIDPNTNIGNLNPSNVIERRRGLEWVLSKTEDWYDIELNA